LQLFQTSIEPARGSQDSKRTLLENLAGIEHDDVLRVLNGTETMRDDEYGAIAAEGLKRVVDELFGDKIKGVRGLVEDEHLRVANEGPREGQTLALAPGKPEAPLAERSFKPLRQRGNELVSVRPSGRFLDFRLRGVEFSVGDTKIRDDASGVFRSKKSRSRARPRGWGCVRP
jgi:hypothetical protein